MGTSDIALKKLLHGPQGKFGYLFPYSHHVPSVVEHVFSDLGRDGEPIDRAIVKTMLNLDYLGWTVKVLLNIDLLPFQMTVLKALWNTPFPLLVASRGASKTFMLAVYSILRAIFDPGSKIIIVGAGLRQAKLVFNYIESIWDSSPVLRSIVGGGRKAGPRQSVDLCYFKVGDSIVYALPLGDGCVSRYTVMTYDNCFGYIDDDQIQGQIEKTIINRQRKIWGNGEFRVTDESYCNGLAKTKKIKTHHGFEIEGTHNHKLKIMRDKKIVWARMDEMQLGDKILLDRSIRWHSGVTDITCDEAYGIGLLIGDGCFIAQQGYRIGFATQDQELSNAIQILGEFRQQPSDPVHWNMYCSRKIDNLFRKFGIEIDHLRTKDKQFPAAILKSSREVTSAFISGLLDTDGCIQVQNAKGGTAITVSFCNTSKELVRQLQYILLHYGIVAHVSSRERNEKWEECYELLITGKDVLTFATEIGFRLKRKQDKLLAGISGKKRWMDQKDSIPDILDDMIEIAENNKPKWHTGCCTQVCPGRLRIKKSASHPLVDKFLKVYGHTNDSRIDNIRCLADPDIYYDEIVSIEDSECVTFDMHVPNGHEYCAGGFYSHNTRIRGFRATCVIADECASIPSDIFDVVVRGFAATSKTPVEQAKRIDLEKQIAQLDLPSEERDAILKPEASNHGNQIIYSGTAYYAFNHFAVKYDMWRNIVKSKGDPKIIASIFGGEHNVPDNFDYRDYAVIRIPHTALPDGLLDARQLANAKATLPKNVYQMEFGAVFVKDSDGIYPRSLIESCTVTPSKPIETPDGPVSFSPLIAGQENCRYAIGIDPAAERDNLAVTCIELRPAHNRVVYCWAVNKKEFADRQKRGLILAGDYYAYCCSKIRDIVKAFNPIRIEMDSQGGGYVISEMLRNKKLMDMSQGDFPIYEIIDNTAPKPTDGETDGKHILHLVKQSSEFNHQANMALHKAFETHTLLFPCFDSVRMYLALEAEKAAGIMCDTYEDVVLNIEELKNELCTIQMSETMSGKERFDTPQVAQAGAMEGRARRGRLRKDRYTSLLLGYKFIYDQSVTIVEPMDYDSAGDNRSRGNLIPVKEPFYRGPGVGRLINGQFLKDGSLTRAIKNGKIL